MIEYQRSFYFRENINPESDNIKINFNSLFWFIKDTMLQDIIKKRKKRSENCISVPQYSVCGIVLFYSLQNINYFYNKYNNNERLFGAEYFPEFSCDPL